MPAASSCWTAARINSKLHEELLKNNAIYQEVYNSQTQGGGDFDKQGGEQ